MRFPLFVINLDRDEHIWIGLRNTASSAGFDPHRVAAVDGRAVAIEDWIGIDLAEANRLNGRDILPGEYGCYRSHLLALETFLETNSPYALIVEDDVAFDAACRARIAAIVEALPGFDVVKLVNHRTVFFMRAAKSSIGDEIGRALHGPQGSGAAYLVSRDGARLLLSSLAEMKLPWDVALEGFWENNTRVYTTRTNVLDFSDNQLVSNISAQGYGGAKYPWHRRLHAAVFRTTEHLRRLHHVLLRPPTRFETLDGLPPQGTLAGRVAEIAALVAVLAFVSALWRETDTYRYAGLGLALVSLFRYFRADLWSYSKPLVGWAAFLCFAWTAYVLIRLAIVYVDSPAHSLGSAEGIYLFPVFYATYGYALLIYVRRPFLVATGFMIVSLCALAATTGYAAILHGVKPETTAHNNPIHAALAAGLILLCSIQYCACARNLSGLSQSLRQGAYVLSIAVAVAAFVNVVAFQSKGVWFALAVALLLLSAMIAAKGTRSERLAGGVALAALFAGIALFHGVFQRTADRTVMFIDDLFSNAIDKGYSTAFVEAIGNHAAPVAAKERLMLWADALAIWARHPVFGYSSAWLTEWQERLYKVGTYNELHNGYLEIAVRYGISGLVFYLVLFTWASRQVFLAAKARLIDVSAWRCYISTLVFFAVTLLTNSNIRLAIGESYMWFAAAIGFYCFYLLQRAGIARTRTYF